MSAKIVSPIAIMGTYNKGFQIGDRFNECPCPFAKCLRIDTSKSAQSLLTTVEFHEHQGPQQVLKTTVNRKCVSFDQHAPCCQERSGTTTKKCSEVFIFTALCSLLVRISGPNLPGSPQHVLFGWRHGSLPLQAGTSSDHHGQELLLEERNEQKLQHAHQN